MARLSGVDLRKWYGQREVVRGVSPEVNQGEIVGLLGPNGAGKTTSFYMLTGIIKPSSGRVLLEDQDIGTWPLHERARVGISYLPQDSSVFRKLTVRQNLQIILEHTGLPRKEQKERADVLLEDFGLTRLEKSHAMHLSGGERRRLEIARALIREPKFVLLDEPFAGVDPISVIDIKRIIEHLRDSGLGVLITDHNVRETLAVCERAYIVSQGHLIAHGTPTEILQDEHVKRVYLGEDFRL